MTPNARRSSRPTASASSASPGSRRSAGGHRRSTGSQPPALLGASGLSLGQRPDLAEGVAPLVRRQPVARLLGDQEQGDVVRFVAGRHPPEGVPGAAKLHSRSGYRETRRTQREFGSRRGRSAIISTNQFKNGNHIDVEGTVFKILEFQHVKPGKGGAFVRTKLRRASDGAVIDRTFRAGEKFRPVRTEARKMQFLYADGSDAHFMDEESYEQIALPETSVAEPLKWVKPNESVDMLYIDGNPADLQLSASVELEVTHTEPGVRGDTASGGGNKPATLETGATVNVPLFVNIGDRIKVDTRSGSYMSRA